ncbi:sterol 3beta-glucosyltransferase [Cladophialophora carrionii]|uniref:Sterol 3beta-glucosyltransferase n=1 Tax=Cladophialophora carrionii TaxID=86049 RepID=A0A1C1CSH6_9EURO|nr:sterol 3beta-glucosyltransferase [Cladophialophora carrionii]
MPNPDPPATPPRPADAIPEIILQEANAAAAAAQEDEAGGHKEPSTMNSSPEGHIRHHGGVSPHLEEVPPPAYNSATYGELDIDQNGLNTGAQVASDGRVNININQHKGKLTNLLLPALRQQLDLSKRKPSAEPQIPEGLGEVDGLPPPPMNIVIQIVGSRGDVQPFVALGQVLKNKYNHRVRIATHSTFKQFVTENGLEFFSIGGDPAELMAFMVKNPGLMPGMDSLKSGDVGKRRRGIYEIINGCWRSCIEAGDGMGTPINDDNMDTRSFDSALSMRMDPALKPFVADAIIANPPSFAHVHLAEKLGIPLHLMFTMPWSPTQSFPHPLANIISSNTDPTVTNFVTYALVDMLTWQGLGDVINKFRERSLGLEPVSIMWAPGMVSRLRIPWTYCWSPALIPKPADWGSYIDISGFFFLNLSTNYTPPQDLADFLAAGPPPVYIGFGSIVVDDPNAMTKMIFEAIKKTGQRAIVSKGWGGLGASELGIPEGVFMIGNCPHDWLFQRVSCVVHHGGAGTTAAGILAGRPTVVVPFFGDQPFWGSMTARAGAGPVPVAYKNLNADKLAQSILEALKPESLDRAKELSAKIKAEKGTEAGAESFHKQLHMSNLRCSLDPSRVAVWRVKRTDIRLSALAATVLGTEGLLDFSDLKLYRPREYETEDGPWEPISGGAAALIGTLGNLSMGIADFPVEILKSFKTAHGELKEIHERRRSGANTPTAPSEPISSDNVSNTPASTATPVQSPPLSPLGAPSPPNEPSVPPSMSSVLTADGSTKTHHRHGSWSHHRSRSRSHSRSASRHRDSTSEEVGQVTLDTALSGAKAAGKIISAGVKSPMDFTLSLAKGFHNAPKLYGDDTVRQNEKIVGLHSGLKVAGREFGYGFYDGITGLVTQPLQGARKEGAAGFFKGAAKGIGGLMLKPAAGIWGLPGYTAKGIYSEISKHFGSSVQNYIIAARTAQGFEDWKNSSPEDRQRIVMAWKDTQLETRKHGQLYGADRKEAIESHILSKSNTNSVGLVHGFKNTRHLSWDERKALAERRDQLKKEKKELERQEKEVTRDEARKRKSGGRVKSRCKFCPFDHSTSQHITHTQSLSSLDPSTSKQRSQSSNAGGEAFDDYEHAIMHSVTSTSRGNREEDAIVERALRASLRELHGGGDNHKQPDASYQQAVQASIREFKRAQEEHAQQTGVVSTKPEKPDEEHDAELHRVLTESLEEYKAAQAARDQSAGPKHSQPHHLDDSDSGIDTDYDEEFKRTIEESKRLHSMNELKKKEQELVEIEAALASTDGTAKEATVASEEAVVDDDDELNQAITASEQDEQRRQEELTRQKTEEEIVLEYVKKQSLREEELKRQKAAESATT